MFKYEDRKILVDWSNRNDIVLLDGSTRVYLHGAGLIDGHGMQIAIQLAGSAATGIWSFVMTLLILQLFGLFDRYGGRWLSSLGLQVSVAYKIADLCRLRVSEQEELAGVDDTDIGEFAVG